MKKKLKLIFEYYKSKYKLKTTLNFDTIELNSFFNIDDNIIFYNLYISEIENLEKDSIVITSVWQFENLLKNKKEGYIWVLLHEIKHAIDYTYNHKKLIKETEQYFTDYKETHEYYNKQLFEKRADRFAIRELYKWIILK